MWIVVAIPFTIIILFCIYSYVIVPQYKRKNALATEILNKEFSNAINGNEEEVRNQFIKDSPLIAPIVAHLQQDSIIGIISCMEMRGIDEFKKQMVKDVASKVLGKYGRTLIPNTNNDGIYYLTITNKNFYYFHFDDDGEFIKVETYERDLIKHIESGKITSKEIVINSAVAKMVERFSFEYLDKTYKFFFYDRLYAHTLPEITSDKEMAMEQINVLFAEPFKKFVKKYRNNTI